MKKVTKILTIALLVAVIVMAASNVFAASNIIKEIENSANTTTVNMGSITKTVGTIIAYLRNAAIIMGVIVIIVIGIKYITGSVEEKADYKKNFIPLIIGIIIVISATSIASFLFGLF